MHLFKRNGVSLPILREPSEGDLEATSNIYLMCYSGQAIILQQLLQPSSRLSCLMDENSCKMSSLSGLNNNPSLLVILSSYLAFYFKQKKGTQELKSYLLLKWFYHLVILTTYYHIFNGDKNRIRGSTIQACLFNRFFRGDHFGWSESP